MSSAHAKIVNNSVIAQKNACHNDMKHWIYQLLLFLCAEGHFLIPNTRPCFHAKHNALSMTVNTFCNIKVLYEDETLNTTYPAIVLDNIILYKNIIQPLCDVN